MCTSKLFAKYIIRPYRYVQGDALAYICIYLWLGAIKAVIAVGRYAKWNTKQLDPNIMYYFSRIRYKLVLQNNIFPTLATLYNIIIVSNIFSTYISQIVQLSTYLNFLHVMICRTMQCNRLIIRSVAWMSIESLVENLRRICAVEID